MNERRPSQTALATCLARAAEAFRPEADRILEDRFAEAFLPAPWHAVLLIFRRTGWLPDRLTVGLGGVVVVRHRAIDDALLAAAREGLDQLVILGAGYDTRAQRFSDALAGVRVFEVDHPATSARKARVVSRQAWPSAEVVRVPVDFERDDLRARLRASGFREGVRTFWAWEGVSMYLQRKAVQATLDLVRSTSAPGSALAMDLMTSVDEPTWRGTVWRAAPALLHLVGEPITFGIHPEDVGAWLDRAGLELRDLADTAELARRYVRDGRRVYPYLYVITARVR